MAPDQGQPLFSAVSSSARQLYLLLRCIAFSPNTQVQILEEGLRFSVEESSVMEGMAFLEKGLFSSYTYNAPSSQTRAQTLVSDNEDDAEPPVPLFSISLPSLLETLQIFGLTAETGGRSSFAGESYANIGAFSNKALGVSGICRLQYASPGSSLRVVLEEQGVKTTCDLTTYEPNSSSDIPFSRENIALKVIMRASYLYDAIAELSANNPDTITLSAKKKTFTLSAASPLGSALVEFHRDAQAAPVRRPELERGDEDGDEDIHQPTGLLETFMLASAEGAFHQSYKFSHISNVKKALQVATKVSIRADQQGVLSLQFMIENLEGGGVSFVDFRFVPLVGDEAEEGMSEDQESGEDEDE